MKEIKPPGYLPRPVQLSRTPAVAFYCFKLYYPSISFLVICIQMRRLTMSPRQARNYCFPRHDPSRKSDFNILKMNAMKVANRKDKS